MTLKYAISPKLGWLPIFAIFSRNGVEPWALQGNVPIFLLRKLKKDLISTTNPIRLGHVLLEVFDHGI